MPFTVIPAEAGIQNLLKLLDSRLRGNDNFQQNAIFHRSLPQDDIRIFFLEN